MAEEIEKLAKDIADRGYPIGGKIIKDVARTLEGAGLIPPQLEGTIQSSQISTDRSR